IVMFVVIGVSIVVWEPLVLLLAFYIYTACKQEWLALAAASRDEELFGYDTAAEFADNDKDDTAASRPERPGPLARWLHRRRQLKIQREQQQRAADERRMDQLLQKINERGSASLTDEERRFMKRVAEWYKNRR
ncbi:MAG: hypothetical protein NZO58_13130, partial [Gemmataceae bacterium]|nr:hypothetical protein [Gemmataceae bacterium]